MNVYRHSLLTRRKRGAGLGWLRAWHIRPTGHRTPSSARRDSVLGTQRQECIASGYRVSRDRRVLTVGNEAPVWQSTTGARSVPAIPARPSPTPSGTTTFIGDLPI